DRGRSRRDRLALVHPPDDQVRRPRLRPADAAHGDLEPAAATVLRRPRLAERLDRSLPAALSQRGDPDDLQRGLGRLLRGLAWEPLAAELRGAVADVACGRRLARPPRALPARAAAPRRRTAARARVARLPLLHGQLSDPGRRRPEGELHAHNRPRLGARIRLRARPPATARTPRGRRSCGRLGTRCAAVPGVLTAVTAV